MYFYFYMEYDELCGYLKLVMKQLITIVNLYPNSIYL